METKTFTSESQEEAERLAEEFIKTLDYMRQPNIYGRNRIALPNGQTQHSVTVRFWGLD